jgi:hypothetical protein
VRVHHLARHLADPDTPQDLQRLTDPASRETLLHWIDRVAACADREHAANAATEVEEGVERLRELLTADGAIGLGPVAH